MWSFYLRGTEKYSEFTYIPSQSAFLGLEHITGIALRPDWGTDPPFPGRWCRAWVPSPQAQTGSSLWPISNWATQQEVSGEQVSKASSVFTATLHHSHYCLNSAYSQRSLNPTVNCACKGSRLRVPYENLMPDDLSWSWGSDAREWLQIQIIISREVWLHRAIINQLWQTHIKTLSVSGKWQLSCI